MIKGGVESDLRQWALCHSTAAIQGWVKFLHEHTQRQLSFMIQQNIKYKAEANTVCIIMVLTKQ